MSQAKLEECPQCIYTRIAEDPVKRELLDYDLPFRILYDEWKKGTLCKCNKYMRDVDRFLNHKGLIKEFSKFRIEKEAKRKFQRPPKFKRVLKVFKFLDLPLGSTMAKAIAREFR